MMIRLFLSLFLLTSCADAIFGIGGNKNSSSTSSTQPKTGILGKIKSAVSSKKTTTTTGGAATGEASVPKKGLLSSLKSKVTTSVQCTAAKCADPTFMTTENQHKCLSTIDLARTNINCSKSFVAKFCQVGEEEMYAQTCETAKEAIGQGASGLGKLTSSVGAIKSSVECTAAKCGDATYMTPANANKCLPNVDRARTNINCSKTFIAKFCQNGDGGEYASTCQIAQQAAAQGGNKLGKLTNAIGSVKSSVQCQAAQCSDLSFMNVTNANKCLPNVDRARTNINCSKAFFTKFCQTPNQGAYAATCQIADQAIKAGPGGLGKLTSVAGKVQSLSQCTAALCSNAATARNDIFKCLGTPDSVRQNPNCSNAYYTTFCQKLRMSPQMGMATPLPHGTEFCNVIAQVKGQPGFGNIPPNGLAGTCYGVITYRDLSMAGAAGAPAMGTNAGAPGRITASAADDSDSGGY